MDRSKGHLREPERREKLELPTLVVKRGLFYRIPERPNRRLSSWENHIEAEGSKIGGLVALENIRMAIEIVVFPMKNGDFPWQNVSSPEGSRTHFFLDLVFQINI